MNNTFLIFYYLYFYIFKILSYVELMPNFITEILIVDFFFFQTKFVDFEFELEPVYIDFNY